MASPYNLTVSSTTTRHCQVTIDQKTYDRRWWILGVLAISVFLVVVDNLIVNVALPTLQSELNATTTSLQWIVDSYALVFAGLLLAGGGLGDRFGRKGALQIGLVLFVICSMTGIRMGELVKHCMPFIVSQYLLLIACIVFPPLVTWLPKMLGY